MTTETGGVWIPHWTRGDRLRKARQVTGMTVAEFAERIGVSDRTVNNAEGDKRAVRKITLNAWALATGVSLDWLETGTPPEPSSATPPSGDTRAADLARETERRRRRTPTSHIGAEGPRMGGYGVAA